MKNIFVLHFLCLFVFPSIILSQLHNIFSVWHHNLLHTLVLPFVNTYSLSYLNSFFWGSLSCWSSNFIFPLAGHSTAGGGVWGTRWVTTLTEDAENVSAFGARDTNWWGKDWKPDLNKAGVNLKVRLCVSLTSVPLQYVNMLFSPPCLLPPLSRIWRLGQIGMNSSGVFVQQLNRSLEEASSSLQQLQQLHWLDHR